MEIIKSKIFLNQKISGRRSASAVLSIFLYAVFFHPLSADRIELQNGKVIENIKVVMEKDGITAAYPNGKTESFSHEEVRSTEFKPLKTNPIKENSSLQKEKKATQTETQETENQTVPIKDQSEENLPEKKKLSFKEQFIKDKNETAERLKQSIKETHETTGVKTEKSKKNITKFYHESLKFFSEEMKKLGNNLNRKSDKLMEYSKAKAEKVIPVPENSPQKKSEK
ncbi:MAG: hypothetical protein OEZ34_13265 [Spirochaetia bacterium]|nr:hypothetical protein [Spirochaetia bacterium]